MKKGFLEINKENLHEIYIQKNVRLKDLPELSLAIEFNGDYWHNRELYENDIKNKTCDSREMLKTRLCFEKNIYLIHMWYSDWIKDKESCLFSIKQEISSRIR